MMFDNNLTKQLKMIADAHTFVLSSPTSPPRMDDQARLRAEVSRPVLVGSTFFALVSAEWPATGLVAAGVGNRMAKEKTHRMRDMMIFHIDI